MARRRPPLRRIAPCERTPPQGFVTLRPLIPGLQLRIHYHTRDNFTGAPLPGYGAAGAWLRERPARALARVQQDLKAADRGLLVFDAYRPRRATRAMVSWARRTRPRLLGPYIGRASKHNHGTAVDLTLITLATCRPLDMGSAFDEFSKRSHTFSARGPQLRNRLQLKRAMQRRGFKPYAREWWHFTYPMVARASDVPYGCHERL